MECLQPLTVLALFPSLVPITVSQLTHAFTFGFFLIAGVDWVNRIIPGRQRALGMGLFTSINLSGSLLVASSLVWLWSDKRFKIGVSLDDR